MNHPYLYPDECPWLQEYHDLRAILRGLPLRPLLNDDPDDYDPEDYDDSDYDDGSIELGYRRS